MLTTKAKFLAVIAVVTGLLIMHGIGMGALLHCLDHPAEHASSAHYEGTMSVATSTEGHGCAGVHDAVSCVASVPKWISVLLDVLSAVFVPVGFVAVGLLMLRQALAPTRWLWPPPSLDLTVLCISRT